MDKEDPVKDNESQAPQVDRRDRLIDFHGYSAQQLRELQLSIDPEVFPQNYRNLLAALEQKIAPVAPRPAPVDFVAGQYGVRSGLLGWIEAKLRRSPLYGVGSLRVESPTISMIGWQRTWLGVPVEAHLARDITDIRNVVQDDSAICFEVRRPYRPPERIRFKPQSSGQIERLVEQLPTNTTEGFLARWTAVRAFDQNLRSLGIRAWATSAIVALNILVFVAMAVATKKVGLFNLQDLLTWGANFGPLTVGGQWWRLFTALFLHFNFLHIFLNMWALWNIGRLSERLFGSGSFLFLYIASGIIASLTSIAWDPSLTSVGASGAIFGVFGAFLAFLIRQRHQIPMTIVRRLWISTAAFVLFNLLSGFFQPGIDNAAHVGGLLAGISLGYILSRPLDIKSRGRFPIAQSVAAICVVAAVVFAGLWQVRGIGSELTIPERFIRGHPAYVGGEAKNLQLWNELVQRAGAGNISDAELSQRFEADVMPFWKTQKDVLKKEGDALKGPEQVYTLLVADFAKSRFDWVSALIDAVKNSDNSRMAEIQVLADKSNAINASLDRLGIRARMEHRPRALSSAPLVMNIRQILSGHQTSCVDAPAWSSPLVSNADDKADGPAMRRQAGCNAQRLFMAGDFGRLDALMNQSLIELEDFPDGSSRYEGIVGGLTDLFRFGNVAPEFAFGRTADWRREIKNSIMAELVEALVFTEWAWSARGNGYANTVSNQNMALYAYRTKMAAAALDEIGGRASENPLWYTLSLEVGLDQRKDREKLQAIFDQGASVTSLYRPLYRRMLRILMPRWGGSYEEVDRFINRAYALSAAKRGFERYAELYSVYARLEGDDLDLFADSKAYWSAMRTGYLGLVKRYPKSDFVLNSFANFACRADDRDGYRELRRQIGRRISSTAWTDKYSLESCDKKLSTVNK